MGKHLTIEFVEWGEIPTHTVEHEITVQSESELIKEIVKYINNTISHSSWEDVCYFFNHESVFMEGEFLISLSEFIPNKFEEAIYVEL